MWSRKAGRSSLQVSISLSLFFSLFKLLLILVNISMYFRIRMYEHEGQWEKAVITYDIGLQQHAAEQEVDLLKVRVYWI